MPNLLGLLSSHEPRPRSLGPQVHFPFVPDSEPKWPDPSLSLCWWGEGLAGRRKWTKKGG